MNKRLYVIFHKNRNIIENIEGQTFYSINELKEKIYEEGLAERSDTFTALPIENFVRKINNQEVDGFLSNAFITYVFIRYNECVPLPKGHYQYLYVDNMDIGVGTLYSADSYNFNEVYKKKVETEKLCDAELQDDNIVIYRNFVFLLFYNLADAYNYAVSRDQANYITFA